MNLCNYVVLTMRKRRLIWQVAVAGCLLLLNTVTAYATGATGGLDTIQGVNILPLQVQGTTLLYLQGAVPAAGAVPSTPPMAIFGGAVGVGTLMPAASLDVAGGIRIGADQASPLDPNTGCFAAREGALRYNKDNHSLEYCTTADEGATYTWSQVGHPTMVQ